MINANELRIGNWVTYNPVSVDEGAIISPLEISCVDKQVGVILDDGFTNCYTWDEILPILLTPEILEKCGFATVKNEMQMGGIECILEIDEKTKLSSCGGMDGAQWVLCLCEGNYFANNIQYLHQLQNLYFALTGQELNYTP